MLWTVHAVPASLLYEVFHAAREACPLADASLVLGPSLGSPDEPYVAVGFTTDTAPMDAVWLAPALGEHGKRVWMVRGDNRHHSFDIRQGQASVAVCETAEVEFVMWSVDEAVDLIGLMHFARFELDDPELDGTRFSLTDPSPKLLPPPPVCAVTKQPLDVKESERFEVAVGSARRSEFVRKAVIAELNARLQDPAVDEETLENVLRFSSQLNDGLFNLRLGRWAESRLDRSTPALYWLRKIAEQTKSAKLLERIAKIEKRKSPLGKLELALNNKDAAAVRAVLCDRKGPSSGEPYDQVLALLGLSSPADAEQMMHEFNNWRSWSDFNRMTLIVDPEEQLLALKGIPVDEEPGQALLVEAATAFCRRRLGDDVPDGLVNRLLAVPHHRTSFWLRQLTRPL